MLFSNFPKHLFSFVCNTLELCLNVTHSKDKDPKPSEVKRSVFLHLAFGQALLGNSGVVGVFGFFCLFVSFVCLLFLVWFSCEGIHSRQLKSVGVLISVASEP